LILFKVYNFASLLLRPRATPFPAPHERLLMGIEIQHAWTISTGRSSALKYARAVDFWATMSPIRLI